MRVELITCYYREEFLVPLFMLHYEPWVDQFTFLTNKIRGGLEFDDEEKQAWVNDAIRRSQADWVVLVDMDEFIFPENHQDPRLLLECNIADIFYSRMVRCWRHRDDFDIDRMKAPVPQRCFGQADHYKPAVFKPQGVSVGAGNHDANVPGHYIRGEDWAGAHWANADAEFWVTRETRDRGPRLSERNKGRGHGTHTLRTKEQILAECEAHLDDPRVI
jgi:hypothetical protein